ncbi:protein CLP1 homolog isoform X2 [Adelges cooleyi]|nr:protein CLP1 homolog isoform X2 [Adelges cooleyi]
MPKKIGEQLFILKPDKELRFKVENIYETVLLELKSGVAEIFGSILVIGKPYTFHFGSYVSIFTWKGCILKLCGKKGFTYTISNVTPMMSYLKCHASLEQLRQKAEQQKCRGPITMVVGSKNTGKSTLCRILLNYAAKTGDNDRKPIYVDLDPDRGQISIPGTIGAVLVEKPAEPDEQFSHIAPLIYHYGHNYINNDFATFNTLVTQMAKIIHARMAVNPIINNSGIIINTSGQIEGKYYDTLTHIALAFEVDVILVLDEDQLYDHLLQDMPNFVKVLYLPKSDWLPVRSKEMRRLTMENRIREYFFSKPKTKFYPYTCCVKFKDIKVFGISEVDFKPALVLVNPDRNMMYHILAVSFATTTEEDIIRTNIAGFVCVINVSTKQKRLILLSPLPKPLPDAVYLISDTKFIVRQH